MSDRLIVPTYAGAYSGFDTCLGDVDTAILIFDPDSMELLAREPGPRCLNHTGGIEGDDEGFIGVSRQVEGFYLSRFDKNALLIESHFLPLPDQLVTDSTYLNLWVPSGDRIYALFRSDRFSPGQDILVRIDPSTTETVEIVVLTPGTRIVAIVPTEQGVVFLEDSSDELWVYDPENLELTNRIKITSLIEERLMRSMVFHAPSNRFFIAETAYSSPGIFAFEVGPGVTRSIAHFEEDLDTERLAPLPKHPDLYLVVSRLFGSDARSLQLKLAILDANAGNFIPGIVPLSNSETTVVAQPLVDKTRGVAWIALHADNEIVRIAPE